jgi:hypothetical protein
MMGGKMGIRGRSFLTIGLLTAAFSVTCSAMEDPTKPQLCEAGHVIARQTPPGGYDFGTTSWMRPVNNGFAYWACVQNNEEVRQLFVDWHIPTVNGVAVPHDSISKPRVFSKRDTADINGCLIYGNSREVMKVEFLGHQNDVGDASKEGDCASLRAQKSASLGATEGQSDDFPNFVVSGRTTFPSNTSDVENTLIRFVYEVGLSPDKGNYNLLFNYAAAPVNPESFKGSIKDISIRPSDGVVSGAWKKAGRSGQLEDFKGSFATQMALPKQLKLVQQSYIIYDLKGVAVGEIPAPFLLPPD